MNENNKFANQFIDLWQENFEKVMTSDENMRQMQQLLESMKGFYATGKNAAEQSTDKSASATDSNAHSDGELVEHLRSISRRLDELEKRVADIDRNNS